MRIYELIINEKSLCLAYVEDALHPINSRFGGESKLGVWTPIEVETYFKRKYREFVKYAIGQPVISASVKSQIGTDILSEVEFLPLIHKELDLVMLNITNVLDCVDWGRSDVSTTDAGNFAGFKKLVFDINKIPDQTYMFKIEETAGTTVYVTDKFKELIEKNNIKGVDLPIVYDSEFTEKKEQEQAEKYAAALAAIEQNKGPEISYDEARELVDQGKAFASGKWKIQQIQKGGFVLGELLPDLTYQWISPIYIPPVLLGMMWHEVDKSNI